MGPDPTAGAVQPDEGQGGTGTLDGLYDLSSAPDELRPHLESELKKIQGNIGRKLEEHASYRKQWEPFESIDGLHDVPGEELTELLQFREALTSDPASLEDWWTQFGQQMDWLDGDDAGEPEGGGQDDPTKAIVEQVLDALRGEIEPLKQHISSQEQEKATAAESQRITEQLAELKEQHGDFDQDAVLELAAHYLQQGDEDAISRGFERYQQITGKAQGDLLERKEQQPGPGLSGGRPDTSPERITSFKDAGAAALARLG